MASWRESAAQDADKTAAALFRQLATLDPAQAQSSVRPPEGAVSGGSPGSGPTGGAVPGGASGFSSDSQHWRAIRQVIQGTVSIPDKKAGQLVQSEGDAWRAYKNGPLANWGAWGLLAVIVVLAVFYLIRGRIRVEHGMSGKKMLRFAEMERLAHWLLAVSFIILALTGLNITYGKYFLLPVIGKSAFSGITYAGKMLHNYTAFAFMAGLVMILVLWIRENFPNVHDLKWLAKGGGMFTKGVHPPARKFNAGQKIIFWVVLLGGISISMSGLALMFPFQTAMFAKTFAVLNVFGFDLPTQLTAVQEMQYASNWHAIVAFVLIGVIIAHIYIGTIGMEGAFDAMGSGEVDENWAKEHHSIWVKETREAEQAKGKKKKSGAAAAPAE
jgi:formate dehydrogenase subunit gamma